MSPPRKFNGPPNSYWGPQYARPVSRAVFERGVKDQFPDLRGTRAKGGYQYTATVPVPHYEDRKIRIRFSGNCDVPTIFVDGPKKSPHRYSGGGLCMWYPNDPVVNRWVFDDGLLALIGLVMVHLFREAWWQETGEWVGEEVPHGPEDKE